MGCVSDQLREAYERSGLTYEDIAYASGLSVSTVQRAINKRYGTVSVLTLEAIGPTLGLFTVELGHYRGPVCAKPRADACELP